MNHIDDHIHPIEFVFLLVAIVGVFAIFFI